MTKTPTIPRVKMKLEMLIIILLLLDLTTGDNTLANNCEHLSQKSLVFILGQAFNPRYMSIEPPDTKRSVLGPKRSSHEIPFYADEDVVSVGDYPAWETNHLSYFEKKKQREDKKSLTQEEKDGRMRRAFVEIVTLTNMFKARPWECPSKITWIDLGMHYFPRYIRSIECVQKKCWYGHFNCKAKSFTVKVLRRQIGACIRISSKLAMVTADTFEKDYAELWVWEELSLNFCCDCVVGNF